MNRLRCVAFAGGIAILSIIVGGCGGGSGVGLTDGGSVDLTGKIHEYVGDGGGSAKPWPALIPRPSGAVETSGFSERLSDAAHALLGRVPRKQIRWYKVRGTTSACTWLVTLQPSANQDTDLYTIEGSGADYGDGAGGLGFSNRAPTGGADAAGGYVPDWVAFDTPAGTDGSPSAQIAAYGPAAGPSTRRFQIEADKVITLTVGGAAASGALAGNQSDWYRFDATTGHEYTVDLAATSGDPDVYVYRNASTEFVGESTAVGGGAVTFTAAESGRHYIRVYGHGAPCTYGISVSGQPEGGGGATYYAVLVGVADYEGSGDDLDYPDDDATDMRAALLAAGNWQAANIRLILNRGATRQAVRNAIDWLVGAADADDVILFYFSGHGTSEDDVAPLDEPDGFDEYLCTTNGADIRDDELGNWLAPAQTSRVLVILDTCFSGGQIKGVGGGKRIKSLRTAAARAGLDNDIIGDLVNARRRRDLNDNGVGVVLTACDQDEYSYETPEYENGDFTEFVLDGIVAQGSGLPADSNSNLCASGEEVFAHVSASEITEWQTPQMFDADPAGELDFVRKLE